MDHPRGESKTRWTVLALSVATNTLVAAIPGMCMPVLFSEISKELNLSLVQIGLTWGISSLPGIFTVLLGGALGDRFGPKRMLMMGCVLVGLTGALRGLAVDFYTLTGAMFLMGMVSPLITMNTVKNTGMWFSRRQLGLASGFLSMGMAFGFLIASLVSASVLSPALGGWRNVLFLYGAIDLALCLPWLLVKTPPVTSLEGLAHHHGGSMRASIAHVVRIRNIWLLGLTILGVSGCVQGALGYLPLFLRNQGWAGPMADTATAAFHTISLVCSIPIALLSDRLGTRKRVLQVASLMIILGIGLLSVVSGPAVWLAVCIAGMVRDGFMAVYITAVIETEGVGVAYAGSATGLVMVFGSIGTLISPPLGNSLAALSPGLPFAFWAGLLAFGSIGLAGTRDQIAQPTPSIK